MIVRDLFAVLILALLFYLLAGPLAAIIVLLICAIFLMVFDGRRRL